MDKAERWSLQLGWIAEEMFGHADQIAQENKTLCKFLRKTADQLRLASGELKPFPAPQGVKAIVTNGKGEPRLKEGSQVYVAVLNCPTDKTPSVELLDEYYNALYGGAMQLEVKPDGGIVADGRKYRLLGLQTFTSQQEFAGWVKAKKAGK